MKDLKAFMEKVSKDKAFAKRVNSAATAADVVEMAANEGYHFNENDLMQVAGGVLGGLELNMEDVNANINASLVDVVNKEININTSGSGNTVQNTGSIS